MRGNFHKLADFGVGCEMAEKLTGAHRGDGSAQHRMDLRSGALIGEVTGQRAAYLHCGVDRRNARERSGSIPVRNAWLSADDLFEVVAARQ